VGLYYGIDLEKLDLCTKKKALRDPEIELREIYADWAGALKTNKALFFGGDKPNLADLEVFSSLEALCNYPQGRIYVTSDLKDWYRRMVKTIGHTTTI